VVLGQLRLGEVSAESHASQQGQPEENDLDRAPAPPAGRCSAVTPPARHAASLPYGLRDVREPPFCSPRLRLDRGSAAARIRLICERIRR